MAHKQLSVRLAFGFILLGCFALMLGGQALAASDKSKTNSESYTIGKGDVLEINVWKEEELTRTVKVRTDGQISLPLIDDVQAAGRTPMQLKDTIQGRLSDYIEGPVVTVIVQAQESRKYYLIGEVAQTGEYPLTKDLTVLQAIALAGGFTEWADKDSILLIRRYQDGEQRKRIDYDEIVAGDEDAPNVLLRAGDTIVVP